MKSRSFFGVVLPVLALAAFVIPVSTDSVGTRSVVDAAAAATSPDRVLDTRSGLGVAAAGKLNPGQVLRLALPAAKAANATSVVFNLTATEADGNGWVRAWPCNDAQPATSAINYTPDHVAVANAVVVKAGSSDVCFSTYTRVHLVVDLAGWFTGTDDFVGVTPNRVLDTRPTNSPLRAGQVRRLKIAGTTGVPADAKFAGLNITVDSPPADGWVVAYPCDVPTTSSTVNFKAGEIVATLALVAFSNGDVCLQTYNVANVIVDVYGYSKGAGELKVQSPQRILDTRSPQSWPYGKAQNGSKITLRVAGRGGVANDAASALLTVTVDNVGGPGFVTAWPCDQSLPTSSTLNTWANQLRSNLALVKLADDGTACLQLYSTNGSSIDMIVDAVGWETGGNPSRPAPPATPTPPTPPTPPTSPPPAGLPPVQPGAGFPAGNPGSNQILIQSSAQQGQSSDPSGNFRLFCGYSHMSYDDPIVYQNQPGKAHLHAFFGNTSADAYSTYDSLRTTGNGTCSGGAANKSAYWAPVLLNNGVPMKPKYSQIYYKSGYRSVAPQQINYLPAGLRIIAGSMMSTTDQSEEIVSWECTGQGAYRQRLWSCGAGNEMSMSIIFPQCWDGVNLDSPNHMSHMAYPTYGQGCPADHPVAIPVITFTQYWDQPSSSIAGLRLSSDMNGVPAGVSAHSDYIEGWDPVIRNGWTDNCIRAHRDCTRGLGDARQLVDPPGTTFG